MGNDVFVTDDYYIFGAHSRARTLHAYLELLHPECRLLAYLADNDEENPASVDTVPVLHLEKYNADEEERREAGAGLSTNLTVFLATRGQYHTAIRARLTACGFTRIIPVTPALDMAMRNAYLSRYLPSVGKTFTKMDASAPGSDDLRDTGNTACIYVAKTVFDAQLAEPYLPAPYERILQVGAVLTKDRLTDAEYTDCDTSGREAIDQISGQNRQFCELTGLYWIWKYAKQDIVGLAHYRRHFLLPGDWKLLMDREKIDVILPVPLCVSPSLEENYRMRHDEDALDCMFACMEELHPEEITSVRTFFTQGVYSPCNMLIARKEVLDELCAWLFPLLFLVAEHIGEKKDAYQNRYPGFLSERLISYFFDRHRDIFSMVYADKNFLS